MLNSDISEQATEFRSKGAKEHRDLTSSADSRASQFAANQEQLVCDPSRDRQSLDAFRQSAARHLLGLTTRQVQILDLIVAGTPSKNIAADLGLSQRTVDTHRANIAKRTGTKTLPALVRLANCGRCALGAECDPFELSTQPSAQTSACMSQGAATNAALIPDARRDDPDSDLDDGRTLDVDMRELQHRMKNMMAVIQSMSRQTMLQSASKEDFVQQFSARLSSYSNSIDLLIANNWHGLEINDLIHSQLSAFGILDGPQISADGPKLQISTKAAHNLGLALHELATNAVKYGSLSLPQGRVVITWSVLKTEFGERFRLLWQEFGGPKVTQPSRCGFGRRLIQDLSASALSGHTTYEFHPEGVTWSLEAPTSSALV